MSLYFTVAISLIVMIGAAWIILLCGRNWHPAWKEIEKYRYAHRGLHNGADVPENSLAAFRLAAEKGYGAELDVHLMSDGNLAVIHDSNLRRMTGKDGVIEQLTLEDLENYRLNGTDEKIPLLKDVLEIFKDRTPLIIELKTRGDNFFALTAKACELLDTYEGAYCIESFDYRVLKLLKKERPSICRGQLVEDFTKDKELRKKYGFFSTFATANLFTNIYGWPDFIAYKYEDRKNISNRMCERFWHVHEVFWTIRDEFDLEIAEFENAVVIFEGIDPGVKEDEE